MVRLGRLVLERTRRQQFKASGRAKARPGKEVSAVASGSRCALSRGFSMAEVFKRAWEACGVQRTGVVQKKESPRLAPVRSKTAAQSVGASMSRQPATPPAPSSRKHASALVK